MTPCADVIPCTTHLAAALTCIAEGWLTDSKDFFAERGFSSIRGMFTVARLASLQHSSPHYDCVDTGSVAMGLWVEPTWQSRAIL